MSSSLIEQQTRKTTGMILSRSLQRELILYDSKVFYISWGTLIMKICLY